MARTDYTLCVSHTEVGGAGLNVKRKEPPMSTDTLTITDNRTGKSYEIPISDGAIKASDLRQLKLDPQ